ncbi:MAG: hypothetical protein M1495_05255 [Bacteroidetes bacterium]|nr:hypothetical protein [Bacteroidota bacterium]
MQRLYNTKQHITDAKYFTKERIVGCYNTFIQICGCESSSRERALKHFAWQPRFYDRIIRNEKELYNIRRYIKQNPLRWELDKDKPENICEL